MHPEIAAACLRIAVKGGDWLALASHSKHCDVTFHNWRLCLYFWLVAKLRTFKIICLMAIALGVLPGIWDLQLNQQNQIEKLRPLVAQLDGGGGTKTKKQHSSEREFSPPILQSFEPKEEITPEAQPPSASVNQVSRKEKVSEKTEVKKPQQAHLKASEIKADTPENDEIGSKIKTITKESAGKNTGFSGVKGNGKGWGPQQTALHERAPMHFREIDTKESSVWVSETEVTQRQWVALMGLDLSVISGHWDQAVDGVSWCKSLAYANELSKHEKRKPVYRFKGKCESGGQVSLDPKADGYRLLIESEWLMLAKHAPKERLISNSNNRGVSSVYVGQEPQKNGIYGLQGNAAEWVWASDTKTHRANRSAAVVRHCSGEGNCRQRLKPAERPLGTGLRLARGPIIVESPDI